MCLGQIRAQFERLQTELNRAMADEMRVPLTSIKGFASTLLQSDVAWTEVEKRDFLELIQHESDRLNHLISDMVHAAYSGAGVPKVQKCICSVSDIVDSVRNTLLVLAAGHELRLAASRKLPPVWADPSRMAQVLIILVENAAKHSREGSTISVEASSNARDGVVVTVTDSGAGIPQARMDTLFDGYSRSGGNVVGRRTQRLGLPFCRAIVEAHGGRIWAESKLGQGSKLNFSLPARSSSMES